MMKVVTRAQWLAERQALLELEKRHSRAGDDLARRRRALPWVRVERDYRFMGPEGERSLHQLFGEHSQLLLYHFMFDPQWEKPCPSCSFWADHFDAMRWHLAHRDVAMVAVSSAPQPKLVATAARAGWSFPWYSAIDPSFNADFQVTFPRDEGGDPDRRYNYSPAPDMKGEMPGLSVFTRAQADGQVFHTYSAYARGLEALNATYGALDLMPQGRDEDGLPWTMAWVKRRGDS